MARRAEITGFMNLDGSGVNKTLKRTGQRIRSFTSSATAQFARLGSVFLGIGLVKNIVRLGTAAAETASKFRAVFGGAAASLDVEIQKLKRTIPATTAELRASLATLGQMSRAFGLNEDAANMFSVEMIKLTGDLASFNNMKFDEAFVKVAAAISGEFEPMKRLGIVINQARLEQEALNQGIWDGVGSLSAAQKALVVQSILIQDMGKANGDAAATADSAANKIKFLLAELRGLGEEIGQTSLPAIVEFTKGLASMLELTDKAAKSIGNLAGEMAFGDKEGLDKRIARGQATRELIAEGAISEGLPRGFGSRKKRQERGRLIEERTALILQEMAAQKTKEETAATDDLNEELKKQVESENDPARKKALEDRLAIYEKLLEKAGKLNGIKSTSLKLTKAEREAEKLREQGDKNEDGIVTGREKRAKEREDRKKETEKRRRRTRAVADESGARERAREEDRNNRFTERERANGLTNTVPTQGPLPRQVPGTAKNMKKNDPAAAKQEEAAGYLKSIDERFGKLESAISGN